MKQELYDLVSINQWQENQKTAARQALRRSALANPKTPWLSIIVPVYNKEKWLPRCLTSILQQTFKNFELIVIDDGSTDNSVTILQAFKQANPDKRMRIVQQNHVGAPCARNCGLRLAQGQYLGFVDADDFLELDFYLKCYKEARKYDADLVRGLYYIYDGQTTVEEHLNAKIREKYAQGEALNVNDHSVVIWNAIYKTSFLEKYHIKYFDPIASSHDIPFTARATYYAQKSVPALGCYFYRVNVADQLIEMNEQRYTNFLSSNALALDFINSVIYATTADYLGAFQRCLDRYTFYFQKLHNKLFFPNSVQQEFFTLMRKKFFSCKALDLLLSEEYSKNFYDAIVANNFSAYKQVVIPHRSN